MSLAFLQSFLDWFSSHPLWTGVIIFLVALSESLALVGLLVPGAVFMFAIGTLISTGHLDFTSACLWAIAGAISGDGISYWLGHYYRDGLKKLWPLSRHPQLLDQGRVFFQRHGGKSVLFGRFVGPLRPIIPAIAGMNHMPLDRFIITNVLSGIAWAPLYLLPGMAFGLSLTVASEVAGRLVMMVVLLFALIILLLWSGKKIYHYSLPHIDRLFFKLTNWSHRHPIAGHIPDALIRPDHPEVRMLSLLALLLLLATTMLVGISQTLAPDNLLGQLDKLVHYNMLRLYTPGITRFMQWVYSWGGYLALLLTVSLSGLWLVMHHNKLALWHLVAVFVVPWLLLSTLQLLFADSTSQGGLFPAAHITLAMALYGFMAVVLAREVPLRFHIVIYLTAGGALFLLGFATLYLRQDTLSDVLSGLAVGAIWLSIVGIAYRRHVHAPYVARRAILILTFVLSTAVFVIPGLFQSVQPGQQTESVHHTTLDNWQTALWQALPRQRGDLRVKHHHPLNLQWVASPEKIQQQLLPYGWQQPPGLQGLGLLQWLNPNAEINNLPVQPQVHEGRYDVLRMVKHTKKGSYVLRLWHSGYTTGNENNPIQLWLGNVSQLEPQHRLGLMFFRTGDDFQTPLTVLKHDLQNIVNLKMKQTKLSVLLITGHE